MQMRRNRGERSKPGDDSVHRAMKRNDFDNKVQTSFFITLVNNGLPLVFFAAMCLTAVVTRSLYTTGYIVVGIAIGLSVVYTVWYFVSYLFLYVLFYIKKIIQELWPVERKSKKL